MQKRKTEKVVDEVDLEKTWILLAHGKWSIIISVFIFTSIAVVWVYLTPNTYQTFATIEISSEDKNKEADFMSMALGSSFSNIKNEIDIIQSRYIATKALESINIGTRYFTTKYFKKKELYKNTPFIVTTEFTVPKIEDYIFKIIPKNEKKFRLVVEPALIKKIINEVLTYIVPSVKKEQLIYYDEVKEFDKEIDTPWFNITVNKIRQLKNSRYSFTIMPNEKMYEFIQKGLTASELSPKGSILLLTFNDNIPLRAKEIVDAIGYAYIGEKLKLKSRSAQRKLDFIDSQLEGINKILKRSENKLQKYKATNIVVNMEDKALLTVQKLGEYESKLDELNTRKTVLENILNYIKTHDDITGIEVNPQQQQGNDPVNALIIKIQDANTLLSSLLVEYTELHPDIIKATKRLASLKQALEETIESSLRSINRRKKTLTAIISKHKLELQSLPEQEKQLASLTRHFVVNEKIYAYLLEKRAEIAIIESSTVSETHIVDTALVPEHHIKPKRGLMIILGAFLGAVFGVLIIFVRKSLDGTIRTTEDVEDRTTVPVYGNIPKISSHKDKHLYSEFIRILWTNLAFLQNQNKSKLITMTSTVSGEGKSFTICELGKAIAESNKKVILIDLDMRKGTLSQKCGLSNNEGMSTLLSEGCMINEIIMRTKYKNLSVIPSGPVPPNPTGLIMSDILGKIISHLLNQYDYVILDSPPVGLVADAMMLLQMSDISLFVLKANFSKKEFLKNINRIAKDPNINPGIVLNGINFKKNSSYGYGYVSDYSTSYYGSKGK